MDDLETESTAVTGDWPSNYFNYFTEIEEHFQQARGTALFLLSPLDWALIESWKNAGVPLEAVLRGIDEAFAKWRSRKSRTQKVNSLAFCAQAVLTAAQRTAESGAAGGQARTVDSAPFPEEDLRRYLHDNVGAIRATGRSEFAEIADAVERLAEEEHPDLEDLERRLTVLEQRMIALARTRESEEEALAARRELDAQLRPYRGKMTAEQLSMLERQYLERRLLEAAGLPRLSLFYLR